MWGGEAGVQEPSRHGPHPTTAWPARQCLLSSISGPAQRLPQSHERGGGWGGGVVMRAQASAMLVLAAQAGTGGASPH